MSRKEKATAITKQNIEEAFWSFYCEMPMDKIRINAVMQRAGYNRGTFYEYFSSLEDVLLSIENEIRADFVNKIASLDFEKLTGAEMLLGAVEIVMSNRERLAVLMGEHGDSKFREVIINGTSLVVAAYLKHVLNGKVDCDTIPTFQYFVNFVSTGLWGTIVKWAKDNDGDYNKELSKELLTYFQGVAEVANDFVCRFLTL